MLATGGEAADAIGHEPLAGETAHLWKRVLQRLDMTARSLIAVIDRRSCAAGLLLELALAADRSYMCDEADVEIVVTRSNLGPMIMHNGLTRLAARFWSDDRGPRGR